MTLGAAAQWQPPEDLVAAWPRFGVRRLDAAFYFWGGEINFATMAEWPHSPAHRLESGGAYIVTAATYKKEPRFSSAKRLGYLCDQLLSLAPAYCWKLEAWAVFPNHYHFVASSPLKAETLRGFLSHLHASTAKEMNRLDRTPGRRVWFQYWDSHLTYLRSYLARLNYVHCNAVRHGLVRSPGLYPWCSAGWFEHKAGRPFYRTVMGMCSDRVKVVDDFEVDAESIL